LAIFVGYHVVWNVTPALHTPLMTANNIPIMPKVLPWREVVGEDKPRSARMNNTDEMR